MNHLKSNRGSECGLKCNLIFNNYINEQVLRTNLRQAREIHIFRLVDASPAAKKKSASGAPFGTCFRQSLLRDAFSIPVFEDCDRVEWRQAQSFPKEATIARQTLEFFPISHPGSPRNAEALLRFADQ